MKGERMDTINIKLTDKLMIPIYCVLRHTECYVRRTGDKCNRSQIVSERSPKMLHIKYTSRHVLQHRQMTYLTCSCVCVWKGTNGKYTSTLMIPICFIPWHTESSARRTGDKCNRSQLVSERSSTFYTLNMVCTEEEFSHFQYAVHNCRHVNITKHNTEYTNIFEK